MNGNDPLITGAPSTSDPRVDRDEGDFVSHSSLRSLWNLQGVPIRVVAVRTWNSLIDDRIKPRPQPLPAKSPLAW
jgi:membrane protein